MIGPQLKATLALGFATLVTACQAQGTSPATDSYSFPSTQSGVEDASQQSVAYQINTEHTGYARGPLRLPLKQLWSIKLGGSRGDVQYPIVANGIVVVIADQQLVGLDEQTGKKLWTHHPPNAFGWLGPAYDNGMVFTNAIAPPRTGIGMFGFDERTGKELWSAKSSGIGAPPTAASGVVYASALTAYDESSGAIEWQASVGGNGDSSPVVTPHGIFASYYCPQTYDLRPNDGTEIWYYISTGCDDDFGTGGTTPVLYDGLLFVADNESFKYSGLILNAKSGKPAGGFNSTTTPAFAGHRGFFIQQSTLTALNIPSMKKAWTVNFPESDGYVTPPIIVGSTVYVETVAGTLVGYDADTGDQKFSVKLPSASFYQNFSGSLAFGDGELLVSDGQYLVAFKEK
jgi:outer membrane protein assembly factor BamB